MPFFVRKFCTQERLHQVFRKLHADHAGAEHQHVDVIVLHALMRRVCVMAHTRANSGQLVCGYARPHTAATNQHASLRLAIQHGAAHRFGEVRIVRRIFIEGADVQDLVSQ